MEKRPRALLLKYPGTNCDEETARALETVGFEPEIVPIAGVTPGSLDDASVVVLSGGFSYGDYVLAGRFASLITKRRIEDSLKRFRDRGGYILGICNGFQILTQLDLLPPGSLIANESGRFQCRWVKLENRAPSSPFLSRLPAEFELPIAHAEGRFVTHETSGAESYLDGGSAALTYTENVNGSFANIAGLQDDTGRVFGLMPHPERFLFRRDHYDADWQPAEKWGSGYLLFQGLFEAVTGAGSESA